MATRQERLEDERADRAEAFLYGPLFWRIVHALDVLGLKIVPQDPEWDWRPPVPWWSKRKNWPSWINDWREKPQPKLRVLDGGKRDDDEQDR